MQRDKLTFRMFKGIFMDHVGKGFTPIYCSMADEEDDEVDVIYIDLICEYRLIDGKVKFLAVSFDNDKQFNDIIAYLKESADHLHIAITSNINRMVANKGG